MACVIRMAAPGRSGRINGYSSGERSARMRLIQYKTENGGRAVARIEKDHAIPVTGIGTTIELANKAIAAHRTLDQTVAAQGAGAELNYAILLAEKRVLPPVDHPDPAHCYVTGTGLTHLGSAQSRDAMHAKLQADTLTDSMKMFKLGLEGGKPAPGQIGVAPEWFYKGDGSCIVAPEAPIELPAFAEDAHDGHHRQRENEKEVAHQSSTISMCLLPVASSSLRVSASEYFGSVVSTTRKYRSCVASLKRSLLNSGL